MKSDIFQYLCPLLLLMIWYWCQLETFCMCVSIFVFNVGVYCSMCCIFPKDFDWLSASIITVSYFAPYFPANKSIVPR